MIVNKRNLEPAQYKENCSTIIYDIDSCYIANTQERTVYEGYKNLAAGKVTDVSALWKQYCRNGVTMNIKGKIGINDKSKINTMAERGYMEWVRGFHQRLSAEYKNDNMVITKRITLGGIFFETKVVAVIDISKVSRKVEEMSYLYNKNMKIIGRNLDEK